MGRLLMALMLVLSIGLCTTGCKKEESPADQAENAVNEAAGAVENATD